MSENLSILSIVIHPFNNRTYRRDINQLTLLFLASMRSLASTHLERCVDPQIINAILLKILKQIWMHVKLIHFSILISSSRDGHGTGMAAVDLIVAG